MNFQDLIKLYNSSSLTEADIDKYEYDQAIEAWFSKSKFKPNKQEQEETNVRKPNKNYR